MICLIKGAEDKAAEAEEVEVGEEEVVETCEIVKYL